MFLFPNLQRLTSAVLLGPPLGAHAKVVVARLDRSGFENTKVMPGGALAVLAQTTRESRYSFILQDAQDWVQTSTDVGLAAAAIHSL